MTEEEQAAAVRTLLAGADPDLQRAFARQSAELRRHELASRAGDVCVWEWELASDRVHIPPPWRAALGLPADPAPVSCTDWFDLVHPRDLLRLRAMLDAHLQAGGSPLRCEHRLRRADGAWRWVRMCALAAGTGSARRIAGTMTDITWEREADAARGHEALRDPLTGLASRALLIDRAGQLLRRAGREPSCSPAVLMLDIDGFHRVEEQFGRAIGDGLLAAFGRRLASQLRPGDTAARTGDDEFALLLDGAGAQTGARTVARRALAALERPFTLDGRQLFVSATIGIAVSEPELDDGEEMLLRAEAAMYLGKRSARGGCALFGSGARGMPEPRSAGREVELRRLIEDALLAVHFQPIVTLSTGRIEAFEAFARWPSEAEGDLSPLQFVPIAEEMGLIGALSFHVMSRALEALGRWRALGLVDDTVSMSVNIAGSQVEDPRLPALVRTAVAAAGVPARMLRLDVTERTLGQDPESAGRRLSEVCDSGVMLHLDDFGTGNSSLATLSRLPVAALKLDRSVVGTLGQDETYGQTIARTTIALARSLGVLTIAEGVEEHAQLSALRELGCDAAQGFLFAAPQDAAAMQSVLAGWQPIQRGERRRDEALRYSSIAGETAQAGSTPRLRPPIHPLG